MKKVPILIGAIVAIFVVASIVIDPEIDFDPDGKRVYSRMERLGEIDGSSVFMPSQENFAKLWRRKSRAEKREAIDKLTAMEIALETMWGD